MKGCRESVQSARHIRSSQGSQTARYGRPANSFLPASPPRAAESSIWRNVPWHSKESSDRSDSQRICTARDRLNPDKAQPPHTARERTAPGDFHMPPIFLGRAKCTLCGRMFLDDKVLADHMQGKLHNPVLGVSTTKRSQKRFGSDDFGPSHAFNMVLNVKTEAVHMQFSKETDFHFFSKRSDVDVNEFVQSDARVDFNEEDEEESENQEQIYGGSGASTPDDDNTAPTPSNEEEAGNVWWDKIRNVLIQDLAEFDAQHMSAMVFSVGQGLRFRKSAENSLEDKRSKRASEAKEITLEPEVVIVLRRYLVECLQSNSVPAPWFLSNPREKTLNLRGALVPRMPSIISLCKILALTSWITIVDVSFNDLKAVGLKMIADALSAKDSPIQELNLAGNNVLDVGSNEAGQDIGYSEGDRGIEGAAMTSLGNLLHSKPCLTKLSLSHNKLGDPGFYAFAKAAQGSNSLVELDLSFNAGSSTKRSWKNNAGPELANLIGKSTALKTLNLRWNGLSGPVAIEIAKGLRLNRSITSLDLSWNSFGKHRAIEYLAHTLVGDSKCVLRDLDISYNAITDRKALQLAEALSSNHSLTCLKLDGNPLMMSGVAAIRRAVIQVEDFQLPVTISLNHCGAESKVAETFDVTHPAGVYTLDLSQDYDRTVVKKLVHIVLDGKGEFEMNTMTLNQKPFKITLPQSRNSKSEGESEEARMKKVARILVTLQAKAASLAVLIPGTNIPLTGMLRFEFGEMTKPPVDGETIPEPMLQSLIKSLEKRELSTATVQTIVGNFLAGRYLSAKQAAAILSKFKASHVFGQPVVNLAVKLHGRLSDPENIDEIFEVLSESEKQSFERFAGALGFSFTMHNPTGHYTLDLSKAAERDIAMRLVSWKNRETLHEEKKPPIQPHPGLPKPDFERNWRNARLNGQPHIFSSFNAMPSVGRFEIDFVQTSKPDVEDKPIDDEQLESLIQDQWHVKDKESPDLLVRVFRELSNFYLFTCAQLQNILLDVTHAVYAFRFQTKESILHRWAYSTLAAAFTFWRFENRSPRRFIRLICLGDEGSDLSMHKLRTEIIVSAFARLVDWHGLIPLVINHLSVPEREELRRRLGRYNLFDEAVAVNPYSLDLSDREDRRIMQELVHLANNEEGRNFVDVVFNGRECTIPPGWKQAIPAKGVVRFCYCRSAETCDRIRSKHIKFSSWSKGFQERCGFDWVAEERLRRIQQTLRERFPDADTGFQRIDLDGGGTLSQAEIAIGLFKLGLWLSPEEVRALVEALDENQTGDIDIHEWRRFYTARRISLSEFGKRENNQGSFRRKK